MSCDCNQGSVLKTHHYSSPPIESPPVAILILAKYHSGFEERRSDGAGFVEIDSNQRR